MEDIIQHDNQIYIRASSSLADQRTRVIKHGELFAIFDVYGDIKPVGTGAQGLYKNSTRYLSQMELKIGGKFPLFLSSTIKSDNTLLTVDLSNPDISQKNGESMHRGTFHIFRSKFLNDDSCFEKITITNFSSAKQTLEFSFRFRADFVDMFEIRGIHRAHRGTLGETKLQPDSVMFSYQGLDGILRKSQLSFYPAPQELSESYARYVIEAGPKEELSFFINANCFDGSETTYIPSSFESAFSKIETANHISSAVGCRIVASSERFNSWLSRSKADIQLMTTETNAGPYPYAGIPWFNSVFGRDGITTALQYLWIDPSLARGVLSYLSRHQARTSNLEQDAEPGKILHEFRKGEMVETGEVPFKSYYGSVDSTPLFIILAGRYFEATNDRVFLESIWPNILSALEWIDKFGDRDGDGFVEYIKQSPNGLLNQGWKDSNDCISHADGRLAEGSIALSEVQGYVFEAKMLAAQMARDLKGDLKLSEELTRQGQELKSKFHEKFWSPQIGCYAIALDGEKKRCEILSSNAGQVLFSGICAPEFARKVADKMFSPPMYSGWGIRTLAQNEIRFNPMSYHNGSIWPHDNAYIADGMARYGFKQHALRLLHGLFDISLNVDLFRLPELICGFPRREGEGPTLYPVACSPQAWAAGSVFMLLKAALGLHIDGAKNRISFHYPVLPAFLDVLKIENLRTPKSSADLLFRRHGNEVSVYVEKHSDDIEVNIIK